MKKHCEALIKKDRQTRLSGDCEDYFLCSVTGKGCIGREIYDENDESSQFFSRAKPSFNPKLALDCPAYGLDKEGFKTLIKLRKDAETAAAIAEMEG